VEHQQRLLEVLPAANDDTIGREVPDIRKHSADRAFFLGAYLVAEAKLDEMGLNHFRGLASGLSFGQPEGSATKHLLNRYLVFEEFRMPSPEPRTPGDGPAPPEEDEHGAKLAKFFSELEQEDSGSKAGQLGDRDPDTPV
jgi:hypothetical protein